MTRPNLGTSSTWTFKNATRQYGTWDIQCSATSPLTGVVASSRCRLNIIYAAREETTSCTLTSHGNGTVSGLCIMTRVYSSSDYYACYLRQGGKEGQQIAAVTYNPKLIGGDTAYLVGTCDFHAPLPSLPGTYTYVVIVYPGATVVPISESITVATPTSGPEVHCKYADGLYAWENSAVECSCTAPNLGQPEGRLLVYQNRSVIYVGGYGNRNLTFTVTTVTRHNNALRCQMDWITDDTQDKETNYTISVSYGPDLIHLTDPGPVEVDLNNPENQRVNLTCTAFSVFPAVIYTWTGACSDVTTETCSFIPSVTSNAFISCTAINRVTGGYVVSNNVTVTVFAKPTLLLSDTGAVVTNYVSSQAILTMSIMALPAPHEFTLQPLSPAPNQSQTASPTRINATCITGVTTYLVICRVQITDVIAKDVGYYVMNVHNSVGSTAVLLQIKTKENALTSKEFSVGAAVGVTIAIVVFVIAVIIAACAVVLWRRHWILPCLKGGTKNRSAMKSLGQDDFTRRPTDDVYELGNDSTSRRKADSDSRTAMQFSTVITNSQYSSLDSNDVGKVSDYSDLAPCTTKTESSKTSAKWLDRETHQYSNIQD